MCNTYAASPVGTRLIVLRLFREIEQCHERGITEIWIKLQMAEVKAGRANRRNLAACQAIGESRIARPRWFESPRLREFARMRPSLMAETRVESFHNAVSCARYKSCSCRFD